MAPGKGKERSEALADGLLHLSVDDKRAVEFWEWAIEITDGHYQMDITLTSQYPDMPNNFVVAQTRLKSLGKCFFRDPGLHANYKAGSQEMLDKGFAHKVLEMEIDSSSSRTWYLPHHNVMNVSKPEKTRIVFDCLSTIVLQGPDTTNKLVGVLLRFSEGRIAVRGILRDCFI